jgi:hypothetical protein
MMGMTANAQTSIALLRLAFTVQKRRRKPSAADAADAGSGVDDEQGQPHAAEVQSEIAAEKIRHPEQIDPPDRIGKELAQGDRPSLPRPEQSGPGHHCLQIRFLILRIAPDVGQFRSRDVRVFFRAVIERQPTQNPEESDRAGGDECHAPSEAVGNPRNNQRRYDRADIRSGIKQACRQRAFFLREPLGHGFHRCREAASLSQS